MAFITATERVRELLTALHNNGWTFTNVDIEPEMPGYGSLLPVVGIERTVKAIMLVESSIVWLEKEGELNWFTITPGDEEEMLGMCSKGMTQSLIALRPQQ